MMDNDKQKEALDFAVKFIEGLKDVDGLRGPYVLIDNDWLDHEDALEQIKEILK